MLYINTAPSIIYQHFPQQAYLPYPHSGFSTLAIHAGQQPQPIHGSVNVPVHLSSTYAQKDIAKPYGKFDYTRGGNPTRASLQHCLAALEYGKYAITFASGCGATTTIMHALKTGDHIVVCDDVYGGTQRYLRMYSQAKHGIDNDFVDMSEIANVVGKIRKETKIVWIQSPTNPTLKLVDIVETVKAVKSIDQNIIVIVDNTFPSPYLTSPLLLGADISYHSLTKYIGGHSDFVMGGIVMNNQQLHSKIYHAAYSLGANPSPFDCFLALRGVKTLEQRVIKSTCNAYHVAHYMQKHQYVQTIFYPGLKDNKYHNIARKQMRGFGGIISFRLKGGKEEVSKFLKSLKIFTLAESLGGVESLAQCPAFMTHASVPAEKRAELGIMDNLIRLSLGLESTDDIIEDIEQALRWSQLKEGCGEETVVSVEECVDGKGVKGSECCQKTVTFEVQKKECCVKAECTNEECARECAKECAKECTKEFTKECTKEFTKQCTKAPEVQQQECPKQVPNSQCFTNSANAQIEKESTSISQPSNTSEKCGATQAKTKIATVEQVCQQQKSIKDGLTEQSKVRIVEQVEEQVKPIKDGLTEQSKVKIQVCSDKTNECLKQSNPKGQPQSTAECPHTTQQPAKQQSGSQ